MRSIIIIACCFFAFNLHAQEDVLTYEEALKTAEVENKNILMVFSGSDWCKPCIQLKQNIFNHATFQEYASDHLIHLELDFPYKKKNKLSEEQRKHNESLAERFNPKGAFPFVLLITKEGSIQGEIDYHSDMTENDFINQLKSLSL